MPKRPTAADGVRLLRDFDRDLAKGRAVADVCPKAGIAETTSDRWRKRQNPAQVDADRRCPDRESEVARLKRLGAELRLDKPRLQDLAQTTC
jgi:putative transposase